MHGIPITIDRPKGFVQTGTDEDGKEWTRTYAVDYGYIENTLGGDGEGLDVFLGSNLLAPEAFWIVQVDGSGLFDEYKILLGFEDMKEAARVYLEHVPKKYMGEIFPVSIELMRSLLGLEPRVEAIAKVHPFAEYLRLAIDRMPEITTKSAVNGAANFGGDEHLRRVVTDARGVVARLRHRISGAMGDTFEEHAKAWVKARGLCDDNADYGGELGRAVLRLANVFAKEGHSGMSALYARAYFSFLCDAWDGMHTMILNDTDYDATKALVTKCMGDLAESLDPTAPASAATEDRSSVARTIKIAKADAPEGATTDEGGELRYVLGIVLEPDVVDSQGDTYSATEIRRSAWRYLAAFRNVGLQHKQLINDRVQLVESYIAPADFEVQGSTIKAGTWLLGLHVADDELWAQVKDGKLTGLSIGGMAEKIAP